MENKYDVLIIGAGPAGLECAKQLNNSNLSVLVIEKHKTIGPKICAGGLTGLTNEFDIPEDLIRSFAKQQIVISGKRHEVTLAHPIKMITRFDLGQYQLQQLKDYKNIRLLTHTSIRKIENNKVMTNDNQVYSFKYLVGADGSNSIVRKHLGLKPKYSIGFYYNIPKVTADCIWCINPKKIKSAYIWEFPHQNYTNIGIYFNPKFLSIKRAKEQLANYLTHHGYAFSVNDLKGSPVNYNYQGYQFNNVFLAGDAAGLASEGTGEGISFALISGKEIAKKIMNPNYEPVELEQILEIKHRQDHMFEKFEKVPALQNFLFKVFVQLMKTKRFQLYFGI